uniref:Uncharacterized protein n=1 Tax=Seriola lalandi dorsalis TaxID=1841481 RepID=A0A3B4X507_SERLL
MSVAADIAELLREPRVCSHWLRLCSCDGYSNITEPWRNRAFESTSFAGFPKDDLGLLNEWWRFIGIGGDRVIQSCLTSNRGGTKKTIHTLVVPSSSESVNPTSGYAYGYHVSCYGVYLYIDVALCPGGFYVYRPTSHTQDSMGYVTCEYLWRSRGLPQQPRKLCV